MRDLFMAALLVLLSVNGIASAQEADVFEIES